MIDTTTVPTLTGTARTEMPGGTVMGEAERDTTKPDELKNSALPREMVEQFLQECREQPAWRREADKCCDYYDNNQLSPDLLEKLRDRGQPDLVLNMIAPIINTVLGMEAKSRTDWRVRPEDDGISTDDAAEAMSMKLKHAETESRADRACSDAYAGEIKAGVHWVEVGREHDPLKYPYRVKALHRREIFWDWRSIEADLSDARYLIRRRWMDLESAVAIMPQYASLFRNTVSGWAGFDPMINQDTQLMQSRAIERDTKLDAADWRDAIYDRVCLYEIWYRKWVQGYVMTLPTGRTIEVDFDNPRHVAAINSGMVKIKAATFQKVRLAWYCGPHFLYDIPSPYKHGHYPYVPFFGFREDQTGVPYGLIRTMISPQDEVNARRSKMLWNLNSKRVITDSDSVTDHGKTAKEIARADAYVILNNKRAPHSRFEVEDGTDLTAQQFQVLQESKQEISESSGIHKSMQGQQTGAKSGIAIDALVEQGRDTLGEINDNFRFSRRQVGEMLFSMLQEDMQDRPIPVTLGKGKSKRVVVLNEQVQNPETGEIEIRNDVSRMRAKVVLDDVPSTATFRQQQLLMLTDIARSLPPETQALIMPFIIEATDLNEAWKVADMLRSALNIPDDSPEAQQAREQAAQQQQQIEQRMLELEMMTREAKVAQLQAQAAKLNAEAQAAGQGDDSGTTDALRQFDEQIRAIQQENAGLRLQLADKTEQNALKRLDITTRADTTLRSARISSATQLETAAIAHPPVDLNAVLSAVQALTQKVDAIASKPAKGSTP